MKKQQRSSAGLPTALSLPDTIVNVGHKQQARPTELDAAQQLKGFVYDKNSEEYQAMMKEVRGRG